MGWGGHSHLPLHPKPREQGLHTELGDGHPRGWCGVRGAGARRGRATREPGNALGRSGAYGDIDNDTCHVMCQALC